MPFDQTLANSANRRTFLKHSGVALGSTALASLLHQDAFGNSAPRGLAQNPQPHHRPKVKRVIFLCMAGGPSHLETFDNKPMLKELHEKPMPESYTKGQPIARASGSGAKVFGTADEVF